MLDSTRLDDPSSASTRMSEPLKTSLFFLQTNEIGLLPVTTVHPTKSWAPIFVLGINNGATSGLSAFERTFFSISKCKLGIVHTCGYDDGEKDDQQTHKALGCHTEETTEGTSSTETSPFSQMYWKTWKRLISTRNYHHENFEQRETQASETRMNSRTQRKQAEDGNWPWLKILNSFSSFAPSFDVWQTNIVDSVSWMKFEVKLKDVVLIPRLSSRRLCFETWDRITVGSGNPSASHETWWDDPSTIQVSIGSRVHFAGTKTWRKCQTRKS